MSAWSRWRERRRRDRRLSGDLRRALAWVRSQRGKPYWTDEELADLARGRWPLFGRGSFPWGPISEAHRGLDSLDVPPPRGMKPRPGGEVPPPAHIDDDSVPMVLSPGASLEIWRDWPDDAPPIERHDEVLEIRPTGRCSCGRPLGHDQGGKA